MKSVQKVSKQKLRKLYDITDWGMVQALTLLDSGAPLKDREMFWNEYHERLIIWSLDLEETTYERIQNNR